MRADSVLFRNEIRAGPGNEDETVGNEEEGDVVLVGFRFVCDHHPLQHLPSHFKILLKTNARSWPWVQVNTLTPCSGFPGAPELTVSPSRGGPESTLAGGGHLEFRDEG